MRAEAWLEMTYLVPLGGFARVVHSLGLEALFSVLNLAVGVHLREGFGVARETSLNYFKAQLSAGGHNI